MLKSLLTAITTKKPKIDFEQYTESKDPEPKTLLECYEEAGGFPFVAKALSHSPDSEDNPYSLAGSEFRAIGMAPNGGIVSDKHPYSYTNNGARYRAKATIPVYKRWTLLAKI
jgi:hypothetical protein